MSITTSRKRADLPEITRPSTPRSPNTEPVPRRKDRSGLWRSLALVAVIGIVAGGAYLYLSSRKSFKTDQTLILHTVQRGELPISVVERGTLESQDNVQILCEVDDVRGDQVEGTPIVWLIKNGSSVKKGDLLVELASASHQEQYDLKVLDTERARAELLQAKAKYENQITQNETTFENAKLQVQLAELELEMFTDEDSGTHKLEVEAIERLIDDINNEILSAQANLELKKNEKQGIETLFKLGYAGKSELDGTRLAYMQAQSQYAATMNKLSTQKSTLKKKQVFEKKKTLLTMQGELETSKRNQSQVELDNQSLLEQAKAALDGAERAFAKEEEFLARYKEQMEKCKIVAPQDGMVVYAVSNSRRWWMGEIREGGSVRPRQHILSLPDLSKMQVVTAVHESILDEIRTDLPALIRIEAFPDRVYRGSVKSVAVMAEQQSADTKVYKTVVTIDDQVTGLKPGMTAVVDISVARIKDVLTVPVQAIVQVGKDTWCYVQDEDGNVRQTDVEVGRTNDKFVEIRKGLDEGDQVVLNPMALVGETKESENDQERDESDLGFESEFDSENPPDALPPEGPGGNRGGAAGEGRGAAGARGADRRPSRDGTESGLPTSPGATRDGRFGRPDGGPPGLEQRNGGRSGERNGGRGEFPAGRAAPGGARAGLRGAAGGAGSVPFGDAGRGGRSGANGQIRPGGQRAPGSESNGTPGSSRRAVPN
jgi:RND family efflux transporter MFP subunit